MDIEKALAAFEAEAGRQLLDDPAMSTVLARLDAVDLRALSRVMAPALRTTFKRFKSKLPLRSVSFQFSDGGGSSDGRADTTAAAFCSSRGRALTAVDGDSMGAIDMDSDCGGIPLGKMASLVRLARDARGNAAGQLVLARLARAVHAALATATRSPEFEALSRASAVTFFVSEHDLGDLACFEWQGVATPNKALAQLAAACLAQPHGLIVCGPARLEQAAQAEGVAELSRLTGYPLWCEGTSQLRFAPTARGQCDALPVLLADRRFLSQHRPELVLQFGLPAGPAWARFAAKADCARFVVSAFELMRGHPEDPETPGRKAVLGSIDEVVSAVRGAFAGEVVRAPAWAEAWRARNEAAWVKPKPARGPLTQAHLLRALVAAVPRGGLFSYDQAFPVDEWCRSASAEFFVHTQVMGAMRFHVFEFALKQASEGRRAVALQGVPFLKELSADVRFDSGLTVPKPNPALPIVLVIRKQAEFALLSWLSAYLGAVPHLHLPKRAVATVAAFDAALAQATQGEGLNVVVALVAPEAGRSARRS